MNLGATIAALEARNLLQILAEPNVMAINGHNASFLAGGEFPFPNLQGGGGGLGAVTIQFREFGVRINFTPTITPRGTIRLNVTPEVSSLDFANGLIFNGFTIPALSTRRMSTEVELEEGQTFAIGGLLDNRDTETFNKVPGLGNIPFFGNLFRSRQITKNNSELLVMVTPELVRPIPKGMARAGPQETRRLFASEHRRHAAANTRHGCDRPRPAQSAARAQHACRGFDQNAGRHLGRARRSRRAAVAVCPRRARAATRPGAAAGADSDPANPAPAPAASPAEY